MQSQPSLLTDDDHAQIAHQADLARLRQTFVIAQLSPDPSTQNGVLLVSAAHGRPVRATTQVQACNRFPDGVTPRFERPEKYTFIEHAERNAIYAAARAGMSTDGATMYAAWAACAECARAIVQAGITRLVRVGHRPELHDGKTWDDSIRDGDIIMSEGGVEIVDITEQLNSAPVLRNGQMITL